MNPYGEEENSSFCYFHPKEFIVGVCALCLKERLLSLIASKDPNGVLRGLRRRPSIALPKVFALASFFHRFEAPTQKPDEENREASITSLEDSFISIKFEADGRGSWEGVKKSGEGQPLIVGGRGDKLKDGLRWRKRIGQLIQLARWNRSSKAGVSRTGLVRKVERGKGRKGWIRSFTRRAIPAAD